MQPNYTYEATVLRIVDGDTVDLNIDTGFRGSRVERMRLYGIDTPERGQPGYAEATAYLAKLIPVGSSVVIQSFKPTMLPRQDSFGRWLVVIYVGDMSVNHAMLTAEVARPYR